MFDTFFIAEVLSNHKPNALVVATLAMEGDSKFVKLLNWFDGKGTTNNQTCTDHQNLDCSVSGVTPAWDQQVDIVRVVDRLVNEQFAG